ncbi:hypothetical protein FKM82_004462 [Ascaphus truei]
MRLYFSEPLELNQGEGPNLIVYSLEQTFVNAQRHQQNVLGGYNIHGIKPSVTDPSEAEDVLLSVFGSKGLIVLQLGISDKEVKLSPICEIRELHDWIWDLQWLRDGLQPAAYLGLALGHNSVALYDYRNGVVLKEVHCSEKCILYSAHFFGERWEELALVSGTVFNQLVVWRMADPTNEEQRIEPRRRISGHDGVIFSICYEKRRGILASASDDRSLRVWDVGDLVGSNSDVQCLLVLYGHKSRVWSVKLLPDHIISVGEDSACIAWNYSGHIIHHFKGHKGRGIRAVAVRNSRGWVATGGVDSGIRLWQIKGKSSPSNGLLALNFGASYSKGVPKALAMVDTTCLVVMTDTGTIYAYNFISKQWSLVLEDDGYRSYSLLDVLKSNNSVLCALGNITGNIKIFTLSSADGCKDLKLHQGKVHSLTWVSPLCHGSDVCSLFSSGHDGVMVWMEVTCVSGNIKSVTERCRFSLPVCKQRWHTSIAFLPNEELIVCGDRRGSLMLFSTNVTKGQQGGDQIIGTVFFQGDSEPLRDGVKRITTGESRSPPVASPDLHAEGPTSLLFGIHGKLGVTSVSCHDGFVYSTGRDGCYRQLKVERGQLTVLHKQKTCKGMEWIERLCFTPDDNLLVLGFHSTDFVVWSTKTNEKLHCVPCGGGHRSWSYKDSRYTEVFAYIKSSDIFAYQSHPVEKICNVVKEPVHGREITCIRHAGTIKTPSGEPLHILITSSEDTTVNVSYFNEMTKRVRHLATISDHISSVKTLALAGAGRRHQEGSGLSVGLFTAGGRAEIECYRVSVSQKSDTGSVSGQVIHLASHRLDEHWDRMKNKHRMVKMDPETRYMSLVAVGDGMYENSSFLAAACSDGSVRFFLMCENSRRFVLAAESFYHQRCVLKVATFVQRSGAGQSVFLCSAATDGSIAFWDITATMDQARKIPEDVLPDCQPWDLGTPCFSVRAHQCGINSLHIQEAKDGHHLVASGGDDNSIHICLVAVDRTYDAHQRAVIRLLRASTVLAAHAAQVTGLRILRGDLLASVSVDQRLTLWHLGDTGLQHVSSRLCHVADVAELDCWEHEKEGHLCVLCGQGLEVVKCITSKDKETCLEE